MTWRRSSDSRKYRRNSLRSVNLERCCISTRRLVLRSCLFPMTTRIKSSALFSALLRKPSAHDACDFTILLTGDWLFIGMILNQYISLFNLNIPLCQCQRSCLSCMVCKQLRILEGSMEQLGNGIITSSCIWKSTEIYWQ